MPQLLSSCPAPDGAGVVLEAHSVDDSVGRVLDAVETLAMNALLFDHLAEEKRAQPRRSDTGSREAGSGTFPAEARLFPRGQFVNSVFH